MKKKNKYKYIFHIIFSHCLDAFEMMRAFGLSVHVSRHTKLKNYIANVNISTNKQQTLTNNKQLNEIKTKQIYFFD
jgi:hypothetical protein